MKCNAGLYAEAIHTYHNHRQVDIFAELSKRMATIFDEEKILHYLVTLSDERCDEVSHDALQCIIDVATTSSAGQDFLGAHNVCAILPRLIEMDKNKSAKDTELILYAIARVGRRALPKDTSNYGNIDMLGDSGACEAVVKALNSYIEDIAVTEAACWCIMILSSDNQDLQVKFANAGACDAVLKSLNTFASNQDVIEIICRAIRNLTSNLSIATYCVSEGIPDMITGTVVIHKNNPVQLEAALWVVVNLACHADLATVLGASGMCVALTDVLRESSDNERVVVAAIWALRNMASGSTFNYMQLVHTDICVSMAKMLSQYADCTAVLTPTLWAIANLACDDIICCKLLLEEDFSCVSVVDILRTFLHKLGSCSSTDERLQYVEVIEPGIWAVRNLASGGKRCQDLLLERGSLEALVLASSQEELASCENISDCLVGAYLNLCAEASKETLEKCIELHVAQLVCDHFRRNLSISTTANLACKTLKHLCNCSTEGRRQLLELDACCLAYKAAHEHKEDEEVVKNACGVLYLVHHCATDDGKEKIQAVEGAIDSETGELISKPFPEMMAIWAPADVAQAAGWTT